MGQALLRQDLGTSTCICWKWRQVAKGQEEGRESEKRKPELEYEDSPGWFSWLGQLTFWQPSSWSGEGGSAALIGPHVAVAMRMDQWRARTSRLLPRLARGCAPAAQFAPRPPARSPFNGGAGTYFGRLPASQPRRLGLWVLHLSDLSLLSPERLQPRPPGFARSGGTRRDARAFAVVVPTPSSVCFVLIT